MIMQVISFNEREMIEFRLRCKESIRAIARHLHRDHSVISREISRNTPQGTRYTAIRAQAWADERKRRKKLHTRKIDTDPVLKKYIHDSLLDGHSPEVISGVMRTQKPPELQGASVCSESIYDYIYNGNGRNWCKLLPYRRAHRKKQCSRKSHKTAIPMRVSIHDRPEIVGEKERVGDLETDTMLFSKQKLCLSNQYDRVTKRCHLHKMADKSANETRYAVIKTLESLQQENIHTLTWDNGSEGALYYRLKEIVPHLESFFCDTYASYQKGGVENSNGIVRRYLPRDTDLSHYTDADIREIQERINNTPRKSLNYLTPNQMYAKLIH